MLKWWDKKIKYSSLVNSVRIIIFVILLLVYGCEIEEKIDSAASRCEDKISKALKGLENACLTKEELLELIDLIKEDEDTKDIDSPPVDATP